MPQAQESNLGSGVITFDEGELGTTIRSITEAADSYKSAYNNLVSYFDNELKEAVQGDTLTEFQGCFNERKSRLDAVNTFLEGLLSVLSSQTNKGATLTEELGSDLQKNN